MIFKNVKGALEIVTTIAMLVASATIVWATWAYRPAAAARPLVSTAPKTIDLGSFPRLGSAETRVALIEYSEFECPFCRKFAVEVWPTLRREYIDTGKVVVSVHSLPLEEKHQRALPAAVAAECANKQGKFWELHDALFRDGVDRLSDSYLRERTREFRLDADAFRGCLADPSVVAAIRKDSAEGRAKGVSGTPMFFVGTIGGGGLVNVAEYVRGAQDIQAFRSALDRVIGSASLAVKR